jgi:hypothetical protein
MDSNARRYYVQVTKKTPERWEDYKTARLSLSRAMPLRGSRSENFHFTRNRIRRCSPGARAQRFKY